MHHRPPRLRHYDYRGFCRCFLTASTQDRQRAFEDPAFAEAAAAQLLRCGAQFRCETTAYCLMPEHVHVLWTGTAENAEPLTAFTRWRQWTGFTWRKRSPARLWQDGYWDYVLRDHEASVGVAAYIVNNPVRAGLVQRVRDYPFTGSSAFTIEALIAAVQLRPGQRSPGL